MKRAHLSKERQAGAGLAPFHWQAVFPESQRFHCICGCQLQLNRCIPRHLRIDSLISDQ